MFVCRVAQFHPRISWKTRSANIHNTYVWYVDKFEQPCNRGTLLDVASVRRNWAAQIAFWSSSRTILSSSIGHVCLSGLWSSTWKSEWQVHERMKRKENRIMKNNINGIDKRMFNNRQREIEDEDEARSKMKMNLLDADLSWGRHRALHLEGSECLQASLRRRSRWSRRWLRNAKGRGAQRHNKLNKKKY